MTRATPKVCSVRRFSPVFPLGLVAAAIPAVTHVLVGYHHVEFTGTMHFYSVGFSALVAATAAVGLSIVGARRGDTRTMIVGTAFAAMAGLLALHGFSTPGVIVGNNGVVAITGGATLPVGALILCTSVLPLPRIVMDVRPLVLLEVGLLAAVLGLGALALERPSLLPSIPAPNTPEALGLLAVMVLFIRPAAVGLTTLGSSFTARERAFVAWMAPRGIVAGATASAFGPELAQKGVAGADKVLPIVFVAIFCTVLVYGLSATWVARTLGVAGMGRRLMLIVGGHPWAREIAATLRRCGVAVRMWVGPLDQQAAARDAGLDADRGRIMIDAISREAELEEVTDALLLTASDDFNTLAAAELRNELGHRHVFRIAPHPNEPDLVPPLREAGILVDRSLTFGELDRQFAKGAHIVSTTADELPRSGGTETDVPLFAVTLDGQLSVAADGHRPDLRLGNTVIVLALAYSSDPAPEKVRELAREETET